MRLPCNVAHGIGSAAPGNPILRSYSQWQVGTPTWAKIGEFNLTLRISRVFECDCKCPSDSESVGYMSDGSQRQMAPLPASSDGNPFIPIDYTPPEFAPIIRLDDGRTIGWAHNPR